MTNPTKEYYAMPPVEVESNGAKPPLSEGLSEPLAETLAYLVEYDSSKGTELSEVVAHLKIKPATAAYRVTQLVKRGLAHRVAPGFYRPGLGANTVPQAKPRSKKAKSKADYDVIDVSRLYRHRGTGLSVIVDENGKAKMPKVNLTAAEMRAVALVAARIAEMNQILGLDKQ